MTLHQQDLADLQYAKRLLENPGLVAKLSNVLGTPVEKGFEMLPEKWSEVVQDVTHKSLQKALEFAVLTLGRRRRRARTFTHKVAVATSGGVGGAFGLPALAIELPVSTLLMLRSVADIARSEGEDIRQIETKLDCLQVFALGGPRRSDDAAETGYFAVRAALANMITDAAGYIAKRGLAEKGAPVLVRLISAISTRFGIVVSEKIAAMTVPIVGAAGGALVNSLFMVHFQNMARGHFIVRRLERQYGPEVVRRAYENLPSPRNHRSRSAVGQGSVIEVDDAADGLVEE
ncbi:MAG: EcsC family protein [Acidobacteria bacterium]|nr:EcsC family protein [Acidobacteriota bacterium]